MTGDDLDIRDFPYMPLYIGRLQRSKAWLLCKREPALAFYLVNLWMRSWHEVPSGSLEDDDDVLADAAMCDAKTWAKVREKVLRGWVSRDGRVFNDTVTELAQDCLVVKQRQRQRTNAARQARSQTRDRDSRLDHTEPVTMSVTENVTEDVTSSKGREGKRREDSDLRSAGDPAEVDPKIALWRDGLSTLAGLLGKPQSSTRKLLGKLVDTFHGDHAKLLALIRRAEIEQPDDPFAWLTSSANAVNGPGNGLFADDPWGIGGWLAGERRVSEGAKDGQPVQAIGGYDARFVAERVAEVAHLPASWRGSWRALADWLDEGIPSDAILSGVRQAATWGSYKVPQTISYFNNPVHEAAGRPIS